MCVARADILRANATVTGDSQSAFDAFVLYVYSGVRGRNWVDGLSWHRGEFSVALLLPEMREAIF